MILNIANSSIKPKALTEKSAEESVEEIAQTAIQRRVGEEFELLLTLYRALIETKDLSSACSATLQIVCEFTGWDLGLAWVPAPGEKELALLTAWQRDNPNLVEFVEICQQRSFPPNVGMPGRVWVRRKPEWTSNLAAKPTELFPLAPSAAQAGIKAVLGVPVLDGEKVLAVLLFYLLEFRQKDNALVQVVSEVATQLGFAFRHKDIEVELESNEAKLRQAQEDLDIRVQERTAELVRRGQAWLQSLIETTQDAILSIDRQGRVVIFNPAAERIFGYARNEIIGQKVNLLMAEPYATEHDGYIERYERTGEARAIGRIRTVTARRKSGELFPIELSVTKIAEDQDVQYAAFIRDISEKARLQAQLVENERLVAIGTTAAKIGHELANPLNGMSLTIQLLEQRLRKQPNLLDIQITSTVNRLHNEVSRLSTLLEQFRSLSRREKFDFQRTTLTALVGEAIEIEMPRYAELGIQVECSFPSNLPTITVDIDKMKQVIFNLTKNAAEAMAGGGRISIKGSTSNDRAVLEISDTGTGVPPGIDIFEPFFTTKPQGTGIGLSIVQQIVRAHGGSISYSSEHGKGTTFVIALPRN